MKCLQCNVEATKVGAFWTCPEHGPLPKPKPFAPLRIFLRDVHDSNEELVRRIKADLQKRGQDVWFDETPEEAKSIRQSDTRICQLLSKGFYGRPWLFEAVRNWPMASAPSPFGRERAGVRGDSQSRLFCIIGAPGIGKSAFAAQLTHTRGATVIAAQFCEWDKPYHRNAPPVVRSLACVLHLGSTSKYTELKRFIS